MRSIGSDYGRADRPLAVLCDFDDTVAETNVAELLLSQFGDGQWMELKQQYREKLISLREYQEGAFLSLGATRQQMQAYVHEHVAMRPGLGELWRHCQASGIPLAIVSLGLDFYVEALLEREGLQQIPAYTVKTSFTPQTIQYSYPHTWDGCSYIGWGNCKCSVLESYRERGHGIIYVGDGVSDFCPASRADLVFARGPLANHCRDGGLPHRPFDDFRQVLDFLKSEGVEEARP